MIITRIETGPQRIIEVVSRGNRPKVRRGVFSAKPNETLRVTDFTDQLVADGLVSFLYIEHRLLTE